MSITKPTINKLLSLLLVLSVVLAGLLPSTAVYASEVNTPGSAKSNAVLNSDGLIMDVTVPTNVLIYVDEHGEVTTPDYLPIINNSVAPVFVHSLTVTPQNGWTLDPTNTDYTNFKVNQKNYWLSFNGLDPSNGPIALATPINGSDSLNLVLSAGVAPQRTAINGLNIGEILITFDWDAAEGAQEPIDPEIPGDEDDQEPVIPPDTGSFTVGDVYHVYIDGYGDFVFIPLLTGGVGDYRVIIVAEGGDPETQALVNQLVYKESEEESFTPGVILPGYNPELSYEVYITYVDGDEPETIMKVLSAKEVDPDINFEVHSVDHGGEGIVEFYMTVEAPCTVGFAMLPAGSQPPQNGTSSFNLDYAGTQTRGVEIYGGYDDSIDYDIYIWVYDAEWNPVGPVKVLLAAYDSETGDDDSGSGEYVLATDDDFVKKFWYYEYIGQDEYIILPDLVHGEPLSVYTMFMAKPVKGVRVDNPNLQYLNCMFADSPSETLDLSGINTASVLSMREMFYGSSATSINLTGWDTSNVTDMEQMFREAKVNSLDLSHFNTSKVTNMMFMFLGAEASSLNVNGFDTSNITDMLGMFELMTNLTSLDLSSFDTSNVTNMDSMFYGMESLTSLNITSFDTSNVTNMSWMFADMYSLETLDLSHLNTSNVTNMSGMFSGNGATFLDLSGFNTSNVTNMRSMFAYTKATTLDLSNFDTSKVTNMDSMFTGAKATTIDISSFNLADTQPGVFRMFDDAEATTVYVRSQADIDYIIANNGYWDIPETLNFVIK